MSNSKANLCLAVIGVMRSGNHALINWILDQYTGRPRCFLNNLSYEVPDPWKGRWGYELHDYDGAEVEGIAQVPGHVLICSYEDRIYLQTNNVDFVDSATAHLDRSSLNESYDELRILLIVRDAFNCLASRLALLRLSGNKGGCDDVDKIVDNWKSVARKAVASITQTTPHTDALPLLYNSWVDDVNYRKHISRTLNGTFNDRNHHNTSSYGGGSSFRNRSGGTYKTILKNVLKWDRWRNIDETLHKAVKYFIENERIRRMQSHAYSTRWIHYRNDTQFLRMIDDSELLELNRELFGEIPGTETLIQGR